MPLTYKKGLTNINQKLQKILLVLFSNTIINPRAMMVHPSNTSLANTAMMGSRRSVHFTSCTDGPINELITCKFLNFSIRSLCGFYWSVTFFVGMYVWKVYSALWEGYYAWIREDSPQVGNCQHEYYRIEAQYVEGSP